MVPFLSKVNTETSVTCHPGAGIHNPNNSLPVKRAEETSPFCFLITGGVGGTGLPPWTPRDTRQDMGSLSRLCVQPEPPGTQPSPLGAAAGTRCRGLCPTDRASVSGTDRVPGSLSFPICGVGITTTRKNTVHSACSESAGRPPPQTHLAAAASGKASGGRCPGKRSAGSGQAAL